jgi:pyruvate dehydrogenase E2 component (dihydrolipoamide acetyltransferase)
VVIREFRLPDPGEGLVEAEIVTWHVAAGDRVEVNDIVVEVETSKSLVELPIPYAGTVAKLLAHEGDTIDVGAAIITVDDGLGAGREDDDGLGAGMEADDDGVGAGREGDDGVGGSGETPADDAVREDLVALLPEPEDVPQPEAGETGVDAAAPDGRVPVLVGYGPRTTEAKRRPRKSSAERVGAESHDRVAEMFSTSAPVSRPTDHRAPLPAHQASPEGEPLPRPGTASRGAGPAPVPQVGATSAVLAKPPVRKLARDLGVDLAVLLGSGPSGAITRGDVEAGGAGPSPGSDAAPESEAVSGPAAVRAVEDAPAGEVRLPIKGVRKATAEAMVASAFTAPHVTEWMTCDVSAAMELLDRLRARREFRETRISPLLLVAKAVCLALRRTPELNSRWDEAAAEIVLRGSVNLGVAAATPRGLMVPNIKGAERLSLLELATRINALVATAREGKTQPAETAQGSFTITNVGVFGVDAGTPILNPGEAGILCLGAIDRRPWVVGAGAEERIEPRWVTTLALSFDHRLVDGEQGSRFMADVAGLLSDPGLALVF